MMNPLNLVQMVRTNPQILSRILGDRNLTDMQQNALNILISNDESAGINLANNVIQQKNMTRESALQDIKQNYSKYKQIPFN